MKPLHSIVGGTLALLAVVVSALVTGCGGGGGNSGSGPVYTGEEIVAKMTSPSATATTIASAVTNSFTTLGTSDASSPLYRFPADSTLASIVSEQQAAVNAGNTDNLGTIAQAHAAYGTGMPSLDVFVSTLNTFLTTNYNGSNPELRNLARLIVLTGSDVPETPPTLSGDTKLQPYQAYYLTLWSLLDFASLNRDELFCAEAERYERLVKLYESWPYSWLISKSNMDNLRKKAADLRKLCHEQ